MSTCQVLITCSHEDLKQASITAMINGRQERLHRSASRAPTSSNPFVLRSTFCAAAQRAAASPDKKISPRCAASLPGVIPPFAGVLVGAPPLAVGTIAESVTDLWYTLCAVAGSGKPLRPGAPLAGLAVTPDNSAKPPRACGGLADR